MWSYYLKTLIVQIVIDKPDKNFWSKSNLFSAFYHCLLRLFNAVLSTNLCETFDNRLKLLSLVPEPQSGINIGTNMRINMSSEEIDSIDEEKDKLGETCRKFIKPKDYKIMAEKLLEVTTGLQISMTSGPDHIIEFLEIRVFRLKQFNKLWNKVELSLLDVLIKDPEEPTPELENPNAGFRSSSKKNIFGSTLIVATPELRQRWQSNCEWDKFTDEREERQNFLKKIGLKNFQSNMQVFRSYLFKEKTEPTKCAWCREIYINTEHIFWQCPQVKEFWQEYCLKPGKWREEYNMDDRKIFIYDLLYPQDLDLCSHANNSIVNTRLHKIRLLKLAKEYLIICQHVRVHPLYQELQCQLKAMQDSKMEHSFGRYWTKCPLPPPRGIILFYFSMEF